MTRFTVEGPNFRSRITVSRIQFVDIDSGETITRYRAVEKPTGISVGASTGKRAFLRLLVTLGRELLQ